jgi:WD40 repeat protein
MINPDTGEYIIVGWDPVAGEQRFVTGEPLDYIVGLKFSPDSQQLAASTEDGSVYIYDAQTGEQLKSQALSGEILSLDWSPDGRWIAVGMFAHLTILDAATLEPVHELVDMPSPRSVAYSPDSQIIAVGTVQTGDVSLLDAVTLNQIRTLHGHTSPVTALSWSPDGTRLLSGSDDQTVRIWDPANGNELRNIRAHDGAIAAAAWSPDGEAILTASKDRTVRVWRVWLTLEDLIDTARSCCVVRSLSPAERSQFNLPESSD